MVTTIYNRIPACHELQKMADIARRDGAPASAVQAMIDNRAAYRFNSARGSGIEFALQFMPMQIAVQECAGIVCPARPFAQGCYNSRLFEPGNS